MSMFPTKQWLVEYKRALNESTALDDVAAGWGVGFNGDLMFVITDIPTEDTRVRDLPESVLDEIPEGVRDGLEDLTLAAVGEEIDDSVREDLPPVVKGLLTQLGECIVDGAIYTYIGLEGGTCTEMKILDNPDEREVESVIRGPCATWQQIIEGRPATSAVLSGDLEIHGSGFLQPQHTAIIQLFGDIAADVETTHLFEPPRTSFQDFVIDETVRQPIAVQRFAVQQASWATKLFSPF